MQFVRRSSCCIVSFFFIGILALTASSPALAASSVSVTTMCKSSQLHATLGPFQGTAGSAYYELNFKNVSSKACWLSGYPRVQAWQPHHEVGAVAQKDLTVLPQRLTLTPGLSAKARVRITDAYNIPTNICKQIEATGLKVSPPGSLSSNVVKLTFPACSTMLPYMYVQVVEK